MAEAYTPWEKCRELGAGTFGEVRAAVRLRDGLPVALKRIKRGHDYSEVGVSYSALREIRTMREISHPNVVQLFDVFVGAGQLVLVLELLASVDLEGVVRRAREGAIAPLGPGDVKAYAAMLLDGLAFLHTHFILHRDLKPGNVFLSRDGVLKIGDLGFARTDANCLDYAATNGSFRPQPTLMSPNACTQWYRAPELLLGACAYGCASDAWSAGCVIAELVHLRPLFRGTTQTAAHNDHDGAEEGSSELDQLGKIFMYTGTPTEASWPGHASLARGVTFQPCAPAPHLLPPPRLSSGSGGGGGGGPALPAAVVAANHGRLSDLVGGLLTLNPSARLSAAAARRAPYFAAPDPPPTPPEKLPR